MKGIEVMSKEGGDDEIVTYTVTLPFSGTAVLQVKCPREVDLTDEEAIEVAIDNAADARVQIVNGGSFCDLPEWELHSEPVNVGNVCHFSHTTPTVEREES